MSVLHCFRGPWCGIVDVLSKYLWITALILCVDLFVCLWSLFSGMPQLSDASHCPTLVLCRELFMCCLWTRKLCNCWLNLLHFPCCCYCSCCGICFASSVGQPFLSAKITAKAGLWRGNVSFACILVGAESTGVCLQQYATVNFITRFWIIGCLSAAFRRWNQNNEASSPRGGSIGQE